MLTWMRNNKELVQHVICGITQSQHCINDKDACTLMSLVDYFNVKIYDI